jgi:membrane protease YdiL (CAAX protease family)
LKPDDGAAVPAEVAPSHDAPRPVPSPRSAGLRSALQLAAGLAGLAFWGFLALALASLLALVIVRVGADWLDGLGSWTTARPRLQPRQLAMRELAIDVIRQALLAILVVAAVRWRAGPDWRRALALARPAPGAAPAPGLTPHRLALLLLVWPLIHITWVTGTADLLNMPIRRHTSLAPGLTTGAAALWLAYVLILAPIAEELLVRGALYERARRFLSPGAAIAATGLLFAAAHLTPAGIARPLSLIPLALVLGWVRWRSGRLWPGILLHAWSNLAMIAYVLWPADG